MEHTLLYVNSFLSLAGVLALIWHMNEHWDNLGKQRNQLWCMCLFGYAVLVAGASAENLVDMVPFQWQHVGSTVMSIALVIAVVLSIKNYRRSPEGLDDRAHSTRYSHRAH